MWYFSCLSTKLNFSRFLFFFFFLPGNILDSMLLRASNKEAAESGRETSGSTAPVASPQRLRLCHCYNHCPEDSTNNTCRYSAEWRNAQNCPEVWTYNGCMGLFVIWPVCAPANMHSQCWRWYVFPNDMLAAALLTVAKRCFPGRMATVLPWWRRREGYGSRLQVAWAWSDQSFSVGWVDDCDIAIHMMSPFGILCLRSVQNFHFKT